MMNRLTHLYRCLRHAWQAGLCAWRMTPEFRRPTRQDEPPYTPDDFVKMEARRQALVQQYEQQRASLSNIDEPARQV
jgi:hypothetical protein